MRRQILIGFILVFLAGCGSESFTEIEKDRAPLVAGLLSYASRDDLKQPGQLQLTFFNNRLMQVAFYPEKLDEYVAALRASGVDIITGQELISGHVTIWIGSDFDNIPYVGWADDRLRKQQRRWLSKYS